MSKTKKSSNKEYILDGDIEKILDLMKTMSETLETHQSILEEHQNGISKIKNRLGI